MGSTHEAPDSAIANPADAGRVRVSLRDGRVRVLRFAAVGGLGAALQIALLALLIGHGWDALLANVIAFLVSAQVNFALSATITWRDRARGAPLWRRWALFHGSIAGTAALNQVVFILARLALPALLASAAGTAAAAIGNYLLGDRLVFRPQHRHAPCAQARVRNGAAA